MKGNHEPSSIQQVEKQFKKWRRERGPRETIPDWLWEAAAGLTRDFSVHAIARRLHLNHSALKQRSDRGRSQGPRAAKAAACFVEMPAGLLAGGEQGPMARCVVKLRRADGAEMTLTFHDDREGEAASLVRGFLGSGT